MTVKSERNIINVNRFRDVSVIFPPVICRDLRARNISPVNIPSSSFFLWRYGPRSFTLASLMTSIHFDGSWAFLLHRLTTIILRSA